MAMSHFLLFHTQAAAHANVSAAHYIGDERMSECAVGGTKYQDEVRALPKGRGRGSLPDGWPAGPVLGTKGEPTANCSPLFGSTALAFTTQGTCIPTRTPGRCAAFSWARSAAAVADKSSRCSSNPAARGTAHITEGGGGVPGVPATFGSQPFSHVTKSAMQPCVIGKGAGRLGLGVLTAEPLRLPLLPR
jgi:hypothetical protein